MTRTIPASFAIAALLSMAAGDPALGQSADYDTWTRHLGTPTAKKRKRAVGASQPISVGGVQTPGVKKGQAKASKHKGEIEIESFGWPTTKPGARPKGRRLQSR